MDDPQAFPGCALTKIMREQAVGCAFPLSVGGHAEKAGGLVYDDKAFVFIENGKRKGKKDASSDNRRQRKREIHVR